MNHSTEKNTQEKSDNFKDAKDARPAMMNGIYGLANNVKITLGAKGKNALISTDLTPFVTNDGRAIAESTHFANPYSELAAELLRDAARKTDRIAGDGTTSTILLTSAIISEGLKEHAYGITLKESLDEAKAKLVSIVKKQVIPISDRLLKAAIRVSSESDEYGNLIYQAQKRVGANGYIDVQTGFDMKAGYSMIKGIELYGGYHSPVFRNRGFNAQYENPAVLVTNEAFYLSDIVPLLNNLIEQRRPLVLVAKTILPDTLRVIIENHLKKSLPCVVITEPFLFGKEFLEDFARATGTSVINPNSGIRLKDVLLEDLGTCKKIIVSDKTTQIIGGQNLLPYALEEEARLKEIGKWEEVAQRRVGGLTARIAVLRVTAASESELAYLRLKIEDAVNAAKSAMKHGVLPGGGTVLYKAALALKGDTIGERVLKRALEYPIRQIILNSGNNPDKILPLIKKGGYNVKTEKIVPDMAKAGIIDPAEVTLNVIENAISVAGTFLTTDVIITQMQ